MPDEREDAMAVNGVHRPLSPQVRSANSAIPTRKEDEFVRIFIPKDVIADTARVRLAAVWTLLDASRKS